MTRSPRAKSDCEPGWSRGPTGALERGGGGGGLGTLPRRSRGCRPSRLRSRDRGRARGPLVEAGSVRPPRRGVRARDDPRHQHLLAVGDGDRGPDRATGAGVRDALLQPAGADAAGRGGRGDETADELGGRGHRGRAGAWAAPRSAPRTRSASSRIAARARSASRPCGCSATGSRRSSRSTRSPGSAATSGWARSSSWTWSGSTSTSRSRSRSGSRASTSLAGSRTRSRRRWSPPGVSVASRGAGYYEYGDGPHRPEDPDHPEPPADVTEWGGHESIGLPAEAQVEVLSRIVCQLANEAYFALGRGVGTREDIDTAMRLGFNWPRGPLEWADAIGPSRVLGVLDDHRSSLGEERYRAAPALRRAAAGREAGPPPPGTTR